VSEIDEAKKAEHCPLIKQYTFVLL